MTTAIFKTGASTLPHVLQHVKHALRGAPRFLFSGDTILIAQLLEDLPPGEPQIRHSMTFIRSRRDNQKESDRIWGRHWSWLIECRSLKELERPFSIADIKVTKTNYATGGTVVYLDPLDDQVLLAGGYYRGIGE